TAVKSIVAGQDERLNWMEFNKFINTALPRPDGSNLSPEAKQLFWNVLAEEAYKKLQMEQAGTLKATEKTDEEEWRRDLIQANIEWVYCGVSDALSGYYNTVKTQLGGGLFQTMLESDQKKPPEGKGWLVEVHGYTYHRKNANFVAKTVVSNLARLPIK